MKTKLIFAILFVALLVSCINTTSRNKSIAIQGYGSIDQSIIDSIQKTIEEVYDFEYVTILERKALPKSAFINVKSPRYRADSILKILIREKPDSIDYVIAVLQEDISTTKRDASGNIKQPEWKYTDWGIFGLGRRPGPSSVISTFRIKSEGEAKLYDRLKKVCMHEIGHNLGLKHCRTGANCVMKDAAETVKTVDQVSLQLCDACKAKIN